MISSVEFRAARKCIDLGIPFALYSFPSESEYHFCASPWSEPGVADIDAPDAADGFYYSFFGTDEDLIRIDNQMSAEDVLLLNNFEREKASADVHTLKISTPFIHYLAQVHEVVSNLKRTKGKVVISRLISEKSVRHPIEVAADYFALHPSTFRAIFYTLESGLWLLASPELLLDYDGNTAKSMVLAGTREQEVSEEWDDKNTDEHSFVLGYIAEKFCDAGLSPAINDAEDIVFGKVCHLTHIVEACGHVRAGALIKSLSPTPALLGYPVDDALYLLSRYETHPRHCYGGCVATKDGDRVRSYVNLRCALAEKIDSDADNYRYNIYVGGGITRYSVPADEWKETAAKAASLYGAILGADSDCLTEILGDTSLTIKQN